MRLAPTAVLVLALALPLATQPLVAGPAHGAAPTCDGLKATIVGNAQANRIRGTDRRDVVVAGDGNDVIRGLGGNDVICGGLGADRIIGGPGNDRLFGDEDALTTDAYGRVRKRGDLLVGEGGDDLLNPGYDNRPTTPGAPVVPDTVSYASAPAPVVVSLSSTPTPVNADGADALVTGGDLRLVGSEHADTISGSFHQEWLHGRGGDDRLYGQGGDDVLIGDAGSVAGNDLLHGGPGTTRSPAATASTRSSAPPAATPSRPPRSPVSPSAVGAGPTRSPSRCRSSRASSPRGTTAPTGSASWPTPTRP